MRPAYSHTSALDTILRGLALSLLLGLLCMTGTAYAAQTTSQGQLSGDSLEVDDPVFRVSRPTTYSIVLEGNGGITADGSSQILLEELVDGCTYELPAEPFEREGYAFIGWSHTKAVPEGRQPLADGSWFDGSSAEAFGGSGRYWAQWEALSKEHTDTSVLSFLSDGLVKRSGLSRLIAKVVTAGTNVNVKYVREVDYGFEAWTNERNVVVGNNSGKCFCVNNGLHGPHYDYTGGTEALPSSANVDGSRACLWFGYGGPGESAGNSFWPSKDFGGSAISAADKIGYTHIILNYFVRGELPTSDSNSPYKGMTSAEMNWVKANLTSGNNTTAKKMLAAKDQVSPQFKVFLIRRAKSDLQDLVGWAAAGFGEIRITKRSADPEITDNNPDYELVDARYSVYTSDGATNTNTYLKTDANGNGYLYTWGTNTRTKLEAGTYQVTEYQAPEGFALDPLVYTVTVTKGGTASLTSYEPVEEGSLALHKSSTQPELTEGNPCYSLEGARYGVYSDSSCEHLVETLVTGADGTSESITLEPGTYYVKELEPSPGYLLDEETHTVTVSVGQDSPLELTEIPCTGSLKVRKTDEAGNALEGAVFELINASEYPVFIDGTSYPPGSSCAHITSGRDGIASTSAQAFPYGSYTVTEHQAPRGYERNASWSETVTISEQNREVDLTGMPCTNKDVTIEVRLTATKDFDGTSQERGLEEGMFHFTLSDASGTLLQTVTNNAEGQVLFEPLTFGFADIGTHTYTITETAGSDEEVIYDTHTETVTITIAADTDHSLTSSVATDDDGVVFHNKTVPAIDLPQTGQRGIGGSMAGTVLALVAGHTLSRRSQRRRRRP